MKAFVLLLFVFLSGVASEDANLIVDKILEEGNHNIQRETVLPETLSRTFVTGFTITAYGMKMTRDVDKVTRTRDAVMGFFSGKEGILNAHLTSGTINLALDKVNISTPWLSVEASVELRYSGEFFVHSLVDMDASCSSCRAALSAINMDTPQIVKFKSTGGVMFDFLVRRMHGSWIMRKIILKFFGYAFSKTTLEPFQAAAKHNLCNCTSLRNVNF